VKEASPNTTTGLNAATLREILVNGEISIAPADAKVFEANTDFTGAERIAFSILSVDDKSKLSNIAIGIAWAAPDEWYTMTDFAMGSDIQWADISAPLTSVVYGPYLKIVILNSGTTAIRIKQLTTYAVAR
jgi:hypothetical protein